MEVEHVTGRIEADRVESEPLFKYIFGAKPGYVKGLQDPLLFITGNKAPITGAGK